MAVFMFYMLAILLLFTILGIISDFFNGGRWY